MLFRSGLRITTNHLARMIGPVAFGAIGSLFGIFPVFLTNALMLVSGGALTIPGRIGRKRAVQ